MGALIEVSMRTVQEEVRGAKEPEASTGDISVGLRASPAAAAQINHVAQADKSGFGAPAAAAAQQVRSCWDPAPVRQAPLTAMMIHPHGQVQIGY